MWRPVMPDDMPITNRGGRWLLLVAMSLLFGAVALVAAFLTVNASMDAISDGYGDMRVAIFGIPIHQERGPWQPLEDKMFAYGWSIVGGYIAAGVLLGAGIGWIVSRMLLTPRK